MTTWSAAVALSSASGVVGHILRCEKCFCTRFREGFRAFHKKSWKNIDFVHRADAMAHPGHRKLRAVKISASYGDLATPNTWKKRNENFAKHSWNFLKFSPEFSMFSQNFQSVRACSDSFGCVRTCWDAYGHARMHSEASGRARFFF